MAVWHEQMSLIKHRFHHDRFCVVLVPAFDKEEPCTFEFHYFVGEQGPGKLGWRPTSENTEVIEFAGRHSAPNIKEGKETAKILLQRFVSSDLGPARSRRPYSKPPQPVPVNSIDHESGRCRAEIKKWSEDRYEVFVYVLAPDGLYFPAATPSISPESNESWGRANYGRRTLADSLEEAEGIAETELEAALIEAQELTRKYEAAGGAKWVKSEDLNRSAPVEKPDP